MDMHDLISKVFGFSENVDYLLSVTLLALVKIFLPIQTYFYFSCDRHF